MSPRNLKPTKNMHDLSIAERTRQPDKCQERWYKFISQFTNNKTVLDVGSGAGYGLSILLSEGNTKQVEGFDLLPVGPSVIKKTIEEYESKSWDYVIALDVIEHVEEDVTFLKEMLRVAKEYVFIATPNWNQWGARNIFHIREYAPLELSELLNNLKYRIWLLNINEILSPRETMKLEEHEAAAYYGILIEKSNE